MRAISRELLHLRPKLRDLMPNCKHMLYRNEELLTTICTSGILTTFPFERDSGQPKLKNAPRCGAFCRLMDLRCFRLLIDRSLRDFGQSFVRCLFLFESFLQKRDGIFES